ncbi:uracil-xanthine permease family protein [Salibacterium halotolerans]|uniref:Uracil permease n=1 Tax=Salibacterium halotolerans TaxID=1884432 RepID=A0A1I5M7A1_9BACI|nr:solute carrier family 23 protein [Salibacterium halotolerans]SFP05419.1 uracil permease [Salibacterium halotolerans]
MEDTQVKLKKNDVPKWNEWLILSMQHLFAMFGATILVPVLTGLSPAVALLSSGLGTLVYLVITKGQIPAYLGSSFAFIMPVTSAMAIGGPEGVMIGTFAAGVVYSITALVIKKTGVKWLMNLLPPIVTGPVIIVIGLGLAGTAVDMAMNFDDQSGQYVQPTLHFSIALATLALTIIVSVFVRGFLNLIPILIGLSGGYIIALAVGIVDLSDIAQAAWFRVPDLVVPFIGFEPQWSWSIIFIMTPIAIVTLAEHIGDQLVLSKVAGENYVKKPGLHRSIMGDGAATIVASLIGGPPNTTYGENIGVLAITRVFSVYVIGGAAVLALVFGFIGKVEALIASIPDAVMGGVSILLFGIIASSGLRMLIDNQVDLGVKRNLIIVSVILVIGIGGAFIDINENLQISGMALAAVTGIILNAVLPGKQYAFGNGAMFESLDDKMKEDEAA